MGGPAAGDGAGAVAETDEPKEDGGPVGVVEGGSSYHSRYNPN